MRATIRSIFSPLESLLWVIFFLWSLLWVGVLSFDLGAEQVSGWVGNPGLRATLVHLVVAFDALWIVLGASVLYFHVVREEGISAARKWSLVVLIGSAALWWWGAETGIPCGPIFYTDNLGAKIAGILPFTIPLLWLIVVVAGRSLMLRLFPRLTRWQLAFGVAVLAVLTDLNLEPIAWKVRAYWLWYATDPSPPLQPPVQNYLTWFVAAFLLATPLTEERVARVNTGWWMQPYVPLLTLNGVLLATHLVRWLSS